MQKQCDILGVSRSAYYEWRQGKSYQLRSGEKELEQLVKRVFIRHKRRYGVRRLKDEIVDAGYKAGSYKIRRIMRDHHLRAIQPKSFVPRTTDSRHSYPISPNLLLGREFPQQINEVWVGDITYIPLKGGNWSFLAVWMDLHSRKIVGWDYADHMQESLVLKALEKAIHRRNPPPGMIIHSDRGGQYAGTVFRKLLNDRELQQSMSRKDNPYDNAFMESYFSRFKAELLDNRVFENMDEARTEIFEYIELYYNPIRRHSSLGNISPATYERKQINLIVN